MLFELNVRKMTSGVNFTNILRKAFMLEDSKSTKTTVKSRSFLGFWDLRGIKAVYKHVDEIDISRREEGEDLFSKETLLQHIQPNADHQDYLKFDCKNKAEGRYLTSTFLIFSC